MKLHEIKVVACDGFEIIDRKGWNDINDNFKQVAEALSVDLEYICTGACIGDLQADPIREACRKVNSNFRIVESMIGHKNETP